MKFNKIYYLLFFTVLFCNGMLAQNSLTASNTYFCDFEDSSENDVWRATLNTGSKGPLCANKWYIGKPGANRGEMGLFISGDNGQTANYQNKNVTVIAYRKLKLDAGDYEFSFDWRAGGTDFNDGLYVCWVPARDNIKLNSAQTDMLHTWIGTYGLNFGTDSLCLNQRYWSTITDTISSDGSEYYLVFVWSNGSLSPYNPGVCIDNIMITPKGTCSRPQNFMINPKGTDIVLSWSGDATSYDVQVYNYTTEQWYEYNDIKEKYLEVQGQEEGMISFYVRARCGDDMCSAWLAKDKFFYYPAIRCLDYLNLNSKNCYTGTYLAPMMKEEMVDLGARSELSRHTIHWEKGETDPRTDGKLKTIPDGELASIRLGNNRTGAQGEGIEYKLVVDTMSSGVLLLNYAVVMEDPGHVEANQPRFTLKVLEGNKKLDEWGCGEANFAAGYNTSEADGWVRFPTGWWKDWTTVAIDLRKYHKKSLRILFTTNDCAETGHYGYAYFTLRCSDGKIRSLTCAGSAKTEFLGPDGFRYRWYSPDDPEKTLSTKQKFEVEPDDPSTYCLDVIQPTNAYCYYTLYASAMARLPRAKADYKLDIKNCENVVRFENLSYIKRVNQVTNDSLSTSDKCDEYIWDFGDGSATSTIENPIHRFPDEGGTYTVKLTAKIASGTCDDDTIFTVTLPKLGTTRDTTDVVICEGEYYVTFDKDTVYETGCYVDSAKNIYGCDSISVVNLYVAPTYDVFTRDTICSTDVYMFNGKQITKTGFYVDTFKTIYDCDSVVSLDLVVYEPLFVDIAENRPWGCADDENIVVDFVFDSNMRMPVDFSVDFDDEANRCGFNDQEGVMIADVGESFSFSLPENCRPNAYKVTFMFTDTTGKCGDLSIPVEFDVYYSSSILEPKFNNLITILNKDKNGGYEFEEDYYRWYKNGQWLDSVDGSFYFLGNDSVFNGEDCYYLEVKRKDDGVVMRTCEICPGVVTSIDNIYEYDDLLPVTMLNRGDNILFENMDNASINIYTSMGLLVGSYKVESDNIQIVAPNEIGFYIVKIETKERSFTYKIWVR